MEESWGDLIKQLLYEMTPQTNYHGSGKIFDKFDKRFIGSGQGTQTHGYGFYSADDPVTATGYVIQRGKPVKFKGVKSDKVKDVIDAIRSGLDVKPESEYLYRVNVPNTNFLLDERLPLNEQPEYIQNAIRKLGRDLPNRKSYINSPEEILNNMLITDKGKYFYDDLVYLLGKQEKNIDGTWSMMSDEPHRHGSKRASALLNKYGIKGIRGYGSQDGKINVIFSDKNIKMANTPWQQIKNRIPKETLGKMVTKTLNSPVAKGIGTGLTIANELNPLFFAYEFGEAADALDTRYGKPIDVSKHMKEYDELKNIPMSITAPQKKQLYWTQGNW